MEQSILTVVSLFSLLLSLIGSSHFTRFPRCSPCCSLHCSPSCSLHCCARHFPLRSLLHCLQACCFLHCYARRFPLRSLQARLEWEARLPLRAPPLPPPLLLRLLPRSPLAPLPLRLLPLPLPLLPLPLPLLAALPLPQL